MGADSVLVNAALKLGMARVPGDTAEIFNKQYEGLIEYHKAKSATTVEAVKLGGIVGRKSINVIGNVIAAIAAKKAFKKGMKAAGDDVGQQQLVQAQYAERLQANKAKAAGKKAKLQKSTDILYGNKKEKEKEEKEDPAATLQRKIDAEQRRLQNQKDYFDYKQSGGAAGGGAGSGSGSGSGSGTGTGTGGEEKQEGQFISQEDIDEMNKGAEFLGDEDDSGGDSGSATPKRISPFKQQEEQANPVSRNVSRNVSSSNPSPTSEFSSTESQMPSVSEMDNTIEQMVTDLAVDGIAKSNDHYIKGGGMNNAHFDAADLAMNNIKNEIYNIINRNSITLEEKKYKNKLQKDAAELKQGIVSIKGLVMQTAQAYAENHVNAELSFKGFPNEQMLIKQVMDPKADLTKLGIKPYWKKGELYYDYGDSQMFREYAFNNDMEIDEEAPEAQPTKTIAASKLFGMAVLKDLKSENDINGVINKAGEDAIATLGNTKKLINPDYSRVQDSIKNDFRNIFEARDANLQDVFTRDLMIGNTKRNYKKDLESNPEINTLTYADLGLTDSIDENGDGILSSDELTDNDKVGIIETLTNPRTSGQKEAAIKEAEKYFNSFAMQEFNHIKNVNSPKNGTEKTVDDYLGEISA